jgi:hypothetical protein
MSHEFHLLTVLVRYETGSDMAVKPLMDQKICGKPGKGEDIAVISLVLSRIVIAASV